MLLYYIFISAFYLLCMILFYKDYTRLQNEYFDLLNENCDMHLEKLELIKEICILNAKLRDYKEEN